MTSTQLCHQGFYVAVRRRDGRHVPLLGPYACMTLADGYLAEAQRFLAQLDPRGLSIRPGILRATGTESELRQGVLNRYWPLKYLPGTRLIDFQALA